MAQATLVEDGDLLRKLQRCFVALAGLYIVVILAHNLYWAYGRSEVASPVLLQRNLEHVYDVILSPSRLRYIEIWQTILL